MVVSGVEASPGPGPEPRQRGGGLKVILAGVGGAVHGGAARGGRGYPNRPLVPPTPPLSTLAGSWVL